MKEEKSFSVKVLITFTWSKIMALLILVAASLVAYKTEDASVFNNSIYVVGTILLGRQGFNALKKPNE